MPEMKNICGKIPLDLHEKVRQEIEQTESSTQKFILQVIEEHFSKGEMGMEMRTVAVQVSEELFGRLKAVIVKKGCKQKDFLLAIIQQAIEAEEAKYGQAEAQKPEAGEIPEESAECQEEPEIEASEDEEPVREDSDAEAADEDGLPEATEDSWQEETE
uniref:hypothetical protein n=1 Tax=Faecalicatena contorta TaxID=39482 RepID=UPI00359C7DB1